MARFGSNTKRCTVCLLRSGNASVLLASSPIGCIEYTIEGRGAEAMWIFTRYGFYSIACARKQDGSIDTQSVMVRSRVAGHLRNLQQRFVALAGADILTWPGRDYGYRLIVPKAVWASIAADLAQEQEWSNFKNEAARYLGVAGTDYLDALHHVWSEMLGLQGR